MTVKEYFLDYISGIVKDGNHTDRILELAQRSENLTLGVPGVWDNDVNEYAGYRSAYIGIVEIGLDWIIFNYLKEHCPDHEIIPEMQQHFESMEVLSLL